MAANVTPKIILCIAEDPFYGLINCGNKATKNTIILGFVKLPIRP
jgi:hypothetical protein